MQKIQNMFRKSLVDKYIELSGKENDVNTFLANLSDEIATELKKGTLKDKKVSYEKLYILLLEFENTEWANMEILNLMSDTDQSHKRLGYD